MVLQKYRLELHWNKVEYHNDSTAILRGAYFSGPALKIAQKIEAPDDIRLDLTPQHLHVLDSYYIVDLAWKGVNYSGDKVLLLEAVLVNDFLKKLHKLEDDDYIVIDTRKHEDAIHQYHLVYESKVMKKTKEPHKYIKG